MKVTRTAHRAALAAFLVLVAASPALGLPAGHAVTASCSKATALEVATRLEAGADPSLPNPIAGVLCGAFAGPGSQVMIATLARGTCLPNLGWAAFRFTEGAWQLVPNGSHPGFVGSLSALGSDVRETVPVWRTGDGPCDPSGGTKTRVWHWNGSRFVASPWKQVTSGTATAPTAGVLKSSYFKTPSGNIVCLHTPGPVDQPQWFLACGIKSGLKPAPRRRACQEGGYAGDRVTMLARGRVNVPSCAGDPGALVGEREATVLGYGTTRSGGGIRCTSALTGLTCRNKSGHGFFLSREKWRSF
jgi:hypothetical protein